MVCGCCDSKNKYQTNVYFKKKIGLQAHDMVTILCSIVNITNMDLYDHHIMSTRIFTSVIVSFENDQKIGCIFGLD